MAAVVKMSNNNTPKNIGGLRTKGDLSEQGIKQRASAITRIKENWGVSELIDIFPREIRPKDELGNTTLTNLRAISTLCPDLKKAQNGMLGVSKNPDGSYKPFSFSQSKQLVEQLKDLKNMLSTGDNQPAKKKGATPKASTAGTPAKSDSTAAPPSPLKAKQAKKDKAQAAGHELLQSIGKTSVKPTTARDDEENSITVDTAPRAKPKKNAKGPLPGENDRQSLPLTPAATAPVAVMSAEESQTPSNVSTVPVAPMSMEGSEGSDMATTVPVAVMSHAESQAPGLKANPLKKAWINIAGHDSDSEDYVSDDTGIPVPVGILDLVNGNAVATKPAGNCQAKPIEKPAISRFATADNTGRMVIPSRDLVHPFSNKHHKRLEQGATSNPQTIDKPAQIKKPFTNLMNIGPSRPKTFEPPKRRIQKSGEMKKEQEMEIQTETVIPDVASNNENQQDTVISEAEVNNDIAVTMEVAQVEAKDPNSTITRTQLPSPQKRTASAMLRAADEPNPQVERSIRARMDQHAAPDNSERAISQLVKYERAVSSMTEVTMDAITASALAGDAKAEDTKERFQTFLTSFEAFVGDLKGRQLGVAEREEK